MMLIVVVSFIMVGAVATPLLIETVDDSTSVTKINDYGIFANANADETLTVSCFINADDSSKYDWTVNGETITTNNVTSNRDYDHNFSITINRQFGTSKTWTADWIFKEGSYSQEINGFPTVQVTFARRA